MISSDLNFDFTARSSEYNRSELSAASLTHRTNAAARPLNSLGSPERVLLPSLTFPFQ
jgi:hypothetical protein